MTAQDRASTGGRRHRWPFEGVLRQSWRCHYRLPRWHAHQLVGGCTAVKWLHGGTLPRACTKSTATWARNDPTTMVALASPARWLRSTPVVVVIRQPKACLFYLVTTTRGWRRRTAKVMARARDDSGSTSTSTKCDGDLARLVRNNGNERQRPLFLPVWLIDRSTACDLEVRPPRVRCHQIHSTVTRWVC
jgi:hypothetical protein